MKTGAVIVAAGLSSRMKSFKPLLQLGGSTVIRTAIETLQSAGVSPIVVVTGREADALQRHLQPLAVHCIYNKDFASTDMFHSAIIGMQFIESLCDRFFFLPADVPLFSKRSLLTMMGYSDYAGCQLLLPSYKGQEGHPVLIDQKLIKDLLLFTGDGGLKGALDQLNCQKEILDLPDAGTTMDADKPEEYQQLKRYAATMSQKDPLKVQIDALIQRREPFFSAQVAQLMQDVTRSHSLRQACTLNLISYSKGWKWIKMAESQLGFALLDSQQGGKRGGQSRLTPEGAHFLKIYTEYQQALERYAETLFRNAFQAYLEEESPKEEE